MQIFWPENESFWGKTEPQVNSKSLYQCRFYVMRIEIASSEISKTDDIQ